LKVSNFFPKLNYAEISDLFALYPYLAERRRKEKKCKFIFVINTTFWSVAKISERKLNKAIFPTDLDYLEGKVLTQFEFGVVHK